MKFPFTAAPKGREDVIFSGPGFEIVLCAHGARAIAGMLLAVAEGHGDESTMLLSVKPAAPASPVVKCGHKWGVHWKCQLPIGHSGPCTDDYFAEPHVRTAVVEGTPECEALNSVVARAQAAAPANPEPATGGACDWPDAFAPSSRYCDGTEHHEWTGARWVVSTCPARGREGGGR